jgi:prevent-host-death family protein
MRRSGKIGIRELKNRASRVVDEVRERDQEYIVTKRGKPVAVLRPWTEDDERKARAERMEVALSQLSDLADRVADAAQQHGARRRSAAAVVSEQRR